MPFKPSNDPNQWQGLYTENQGFSDSAGRSSRLSILTSLGMMIPVLYIIIWRANQLEQLTPVAIRTVITQILIYLIFVIGLYILGRAQILRTAEQFIQRFHNLQKSENISEIVKIRVFGVPRVPPPLNQWIKFPKVTVDTQKLDPPDHWTTIIGGPANLEIKAGHALYLEYLGRFSRIVGQGKAFLGWDERIAAVINVGPKTEEFTVEAWTMDGIKVEIGVRGEYFLGRERTELDENILIPFDPASVRKAVEYTYKTGKETNAWINSATGQTKGILTAFISKRYLDQLFLKESSPTTLLSNGNVTELVGIINNKLQEYGVTLSNLQITSVDLPPKVEELRRKAWETIHENTSIITQGEIQAHKIRLREKARAEMQRDLILTIANRLNRDDSSRFPEHILLFISGYLDQNINDPAVRANLGKEVLEILEKLQETIKFPLQMPGNDS